MTRHDHQSVEHADARVTEAVTAWVNDAVIGLGLCPFARVPFAQKRVRFYVSHACDETALVADLDAELRALFAADPNDCETTLLIHPYVLDDFLAYNDFLDVADGRLRELGLDGDLQIASFHPNYRFADAAAAAIENCTNRSPYPILHLLREASVTRALTTISDSDEIYRRNTRTLRDLGHASWLALMRGKSSGG